MDKSNVGKESDSPVFKELNTAITLDDIKKAMHPLKSKRIPGKDGITNEMIRSCGEFLMENIQGLCNPESWNQIFFFQYINQAKKRLSQ